MCFFEAQSQLHRYDICWHSNILRFQLEAVTLGVFLLYLTVTTNGCLLLAHISIKVDPIANLIRMLFEMDKTSTFASKQLTDFNQSTAFTCVPRLHKAELWSTEGKVQKNKTLLGVVYCGRSYHHVWGLSCLYTYIYKHIYIHISNLIYKYTIQFQHLGSRWHNSHVTVFIYH